MSKAIQLTKGYETVVDDEDFEKYGHLRWYASVKTNGLVYAVRRNRIGLRKENKRKTIYLHREINQTEEGKITDHINGNTLDNRKINLRNASNKQNSLNHKGQTNLRKYSNFKGVKKNKNCSTWSARITVDNKSIYLGSFKTEVEAAMAYDNAARKLFGDFAWLNKVCNE